MNKSIKNCFLVLSIVMNFFASNRAMDWVAIERNDQRVTKLEYYYTASDGVELGLRFYGSSAQDVLVLIHGSGYHSAFLSNLAHSIANSETAKVYTPDMRGHGIDIKNRGDIDYEDQLEDDLGELLTMVKSKHSNGKIFLGGHSSGGGPALRMANTQHAHLIDGYVLIAPYLGVDAPTTKTKSVWATPNVCTIIAASVTRALGFGFMDGFNALSFNIPDGMKNEGATPTWTFRMMKGFASRNYETEINKALEKPLLLLVGEEDSLFHVEKFKDVVPETITSQVIPMPGIGHLGIIENKKAHKTLIEWLKDALKMK